MLTTSSRGCRKHPETCARRTTWKTAQELLHSRQKTVYSDKECADLVDKFSQFFVDKVRCIRDNILTALLQSPYRLFATRWYSRPGLPAFLQISIEEVHGSFRGHSNHVKAYWCPVKHRFTTMVGTTYEPCDLVEYNKSINVWCSARAL